MQTPQTIALIGTRALGAGIAGGLVNERDKLLLFDCDAEKAGLLEAALLAAYPGCLVEAIKCSHTGVWEADIIILNASCAELQGLADTIREVANQKLLIVIDADVLYIRQLFPNSKVVQAFSTIRTADFESAAAMRMEIDCPLTGTDEEAVRVTEALIRAIGFKPVRMPATN